MAANEKVLWKLGNLKYVCPNVRRYKLLMLSYLQMIWQFSSAENKSTIKFPKFSHFRPSQLPQYYVGGRHFYLPKIFRTNLISGKSLNAVLVSELTCCFKFISKFGISLCLSAYSISNAVRSSRGCSNSEPPL